MLELGESHDSKADSCGFWVSRLNLTLFFDWDMVEGSREK